MTDVSKLEVEATEELENFLRFLGYSFHIVDLYGSYYFKVKCKVDTWRDVPIVRELWEAGHNEKLDFCNISSVGTFCVSVIRRWDK